MFMDGENTQDHSRTKLLDRNPSFGPNHEVADEATPVVILSTLVVICGSLACGFSSGYSSPAESGIMEDMNMSVAAYSNFVSILTVGGVIGSLVNGKLRDLIGCRGAMWVAVFVFFAGWLAIAFAQVAWLLDLGRLLTGIGMAILIFVVPVYIAEIAPKNIRGMLTFSSQFMSTCGFSLAYSLGAIISWRALALVGTVPCILHAVGLFFIPESPRWLGKIGRETELRATLQRLRGKHADVSRETSSITEYTANFQAHSEIRIIDLFKGRYSRPIQIGILLMLIQQQTGTTAVAYYMSSIFEKADFRTDIGMISVAVINIPSALLSMLLMDECGRQPLLMVSLSGLSISCLVIGLAFSLKAEEATSLLVYIGLMGYTAAASMGVSGLPWLIVSEILPTKIKGVAGSIVTFVHWSSAFGISHAFEFLLAWSPSGTFFILFGVCVVANVLASKLIPETKGRVLEEVQESLIGPSVQAASRI